VNIVGRDLVIVESLSDEEEWKNFVASSSQGTFYHTLNWKRVLDKSFSFDTIYLVIRASNRDLVGVCPFIIRKELKVIKVLDSLWESDYGGPLVKDGYAEPAMSALIDYLRRLACEKSITYAKIRFSDKNLSQYYSAVASRIDTSRGTMMLDLQEKATDYIWNKVFSKKDAQRKYIRRFEQAGYQIREGALNSEDLNKFYILYCNNMNYVGGLPHHLDFFENTRIFLCPDNFNVLLAEKDGKAIGSLGFYMDKVTNTVYLAYLGLDRNLENAFHTSHYLYWGALCWAGKEGYRYVSFGATSSDPHEVHHHLKSKFGAVFNQDHIVYLVFNRKLFWARELVAKIWRKAGTRLPSLVQRRLLETAEAQ